MHGSRKVALECEEGDAAYAETACAAEELKFYQDNVDPAVTIAEVLPLPPSRINGNVRHKHRSQATQLGQNLSHIDAYNGE